MMRPETIQNLIQNSLPCEHLQVLGDDGTHFEALIVSSAFEGKNRIARHQLVYQALGEKMRVEIHALAMKTLTPAEWATQS